MTPTVLVLAAGVGRRYGGSKQREGLGPSGELLLEYTLHDALHAGFGRAALVVHPEAEPVFRERLAPAARHLDIDYVHQQAPLGTGHAVLQARRAVQGPFAVANADDLYGPASWRILREALARPGDAWTLVAFSLDRTLSPHGPVSRAICHVSEDGRLLGLEEHLAVSEGDAPVSMNLWGLTPTVFPHLEAAFAVRPGARGEELFLPAVIDGALSEGAAEVRVVTTPDAWLGLTWPGDRAWVAEGLRERVAAGIYPSPLWSAA